MPAKTNTELILELREAVAVLGARADATDEALKGIRELRERLVEQEVKLQNWELRDRLIEQEVKLQNLKELRTEEHAKSWSIKLAIVSALIGGSVTILVQVLSRFFMIK